MNSLENTSTMMLTEESGRRTRAREVAEAPGPWLTAVQAARHLGYVCLNGRAPNSVYDILQKIGYKLNDRDWRVHVDDLDRYVRERGHRS